MAFQNSEYENPLNLRNNAECNVNNKFIYVNIPVPFINKFTKMV